MCQFLKTKSPRQQAGDMTRAKPLKDTKPALMIGIAIALLYGFSILAFLERSLAVKRFSPPVNKKPPGLTTGGLQEKFSLN